MKEKNILVTGRPRVGKSTLIKRCAHLLGNKAGGFYTEEILGEGIRGRHGFRLITLSGMSRILAEVDAESSYHVGRYGVFLNVLNEVAVPEVLHAIQNSDQSWIVIDEIGQMEEGSENLKQAILAAFASPKRVLATIRWHDSPFSQAIKERNDVIIYKMTIPNRESLTQMLEKSLKL
jgi:nucleoside-triphosphatase THEP1